MRFQQFTLALSLIFSVAVTASAQTVYHIRTDGGDAAQCTGTADAPYAGSGAAQNCAWNHPFHALPPENSPRISGGDTLIIHAGAYKMGYGAPGTEVCDRDGSFDCIMAPVPSGLDAEHPTRILGEHHQNCTVMPELWGSERPWFVFNLSDASYVEVACLDITDHSSCIESHNNADLPCTDCTVRCQRDEPPYGDWASAGIYAEDSHHVTLRDVQVHGLAEKGILAGRLSDWTLERVKIIANGNAGFDGDLGEPSSNSGNLIFRNVEIAWNGCSEAYPAKTVTLNTCWGQQAGGYGDGLGTARTGGRWVFENSRIHHNTSDGLDLLYLDETGSVEVRGLIAEGNAGNQLKFSGAAQVENSVLVSNCAYFEGQPLMLEGDHCRALGNTLSIELFQGTQVTVTNTTMTGQGDCLMVVECNAGGCDGTERVKVRNTLFAGEIDWGQAWENTCLYWHDEQALPVNPIDLDWNLVWRAKDDPCPGAHDVCGQDPLLKDTSLSRFDGRLMAGSPAIDRGTSTDAPARDIQGVLRDDPPDIGAYEFGEQEEAVSSLITHYYQAILGRAPEAAGLTYWTDETARAQALGIDIQEAFRVMAGQFFTSSEYLGRNASDSHYLADLYRTFFNRAADAEGLGFWVAQLNVGLPRSVVMFAFLFSDEFAAYMQGLFGVTASRGEISAVVDFYRGFLNRLPDDSGFTYWLIQFRQAQCLDAAAVATQAEDISRQFLASAEYMDRQRDHRDLIADFYSAFLRRGSEWGGFNFWVSQLDSGTLTVDQVRKAFIASPEFQARLMQIVNEGCLL